MAISRITTQDATGTNAGTSVSATYAVTPTSGNLLVAIIQDNGAGISTTITGWIQAVTDSSSGTAEAYIFYRIANGTESTTVTANNSGATLMNIAIYEYRGLSTSLVLDKTVSNTGGAGSSVSTGTTPTTTASNELLVAGVGVFGVTATSPSWTNSFNAISTVTLGTNVTFTADRIVSHTGAYETTLSFTGIANNETALLATFRATTSGFLFLFQ